MKCKRVDVHIRLLVAPGTNYVAVDRSGRVRGFKVCPRRTGYTWQVPDYIEEPEKLITEVVVSNWETKMKEVDWNRNMTAGKLPQDDEIRSERASLYLQQRQKTYQQTYNERKTDANGKKIIRLHADGTRTSEPLTPSRRAGRRPRV